MTKLEIALQKLIDKEGFDEAKSLLGLTTFELIQKSNCRIDFTMANDILSYLFGENLFPLKYKNCQLSYDGFSGLVDWNCNWDGELYEKESTYSICTPFWDGNPGVPVDTNDYDVTDNLGYYKISLSESDLKYNESYTLIKWDTYFENLASYSMWIRRFYLPNVYIVIQEHLNNYRNHVD